MTSQLLPAPQQSPVERPVADCRVYPRTACSVPTTCQPASVLEMREMRWPATICDISIGGVRLLLQRRFEKSAALAIELPGDATRDPTVVFVKVMPIRSQGNGVWTLGCKFISELSEDEMHRLLTSTDHVLSAEKDDSEERDSADRDDEDEGEDATDATEPPTEPYVLFNVSLHVEHAPGRVVDFVIRKLNAARCWPLTPGKILSFRGKSADQTPWSVRIVITSSEEQKNAWEITGRVLGPSPGTDVMRTLGSDS